MTKGPTKSGSQLTVNHPTWFTSVPASPLQVNLNTLEALQISSKGAATIRQTWWMGSERTVASVNTERGSILMKKTWRISKLYSWTILRTLGQERTTTLYPILKRLEATWMTILGTLTAITPGHRSGLNFKDEARSQAWAVRWSGWKGWETLHS